MVMWEWQTLLKIIGKWWFIDGLMVIEWNFVGFHGMLPSGKLPHNYGELWKITIFNGKQIL